MKKNGFTLVELLAVIVILALLATVATPNIISLLHGSKKNTTEIVINNLRDATTGYVKEQVSLKKISLSACDFEINDINTAKANLNQGKRCVKDYDISFLENNGIFDDKDNACSGTIYAYKYNNGSYTDIKIYIPDETCEVK